VADEARGVLAAFKQGTEPAAGEAGKAKVEVQDLFMQ